jgi:hypothetical protein
MEDYTRERRGVFQGLKVPFCLNALILAGIGMWVFRLGIMALEALLKVEGAFNNFLFSLPIPGLAKVFMFVGIQNPDHITPAMDSGIHWYLGFLYVLWFFIVWSIFAGAINRVYALRIARDETVELKRALGYGFAKSSTHFFSILFIAVAIGFFYGCNVLAGAIGWIPVVGEIIMFLLYFLALISALLITLLVVGAFFGWNLISSSIAVDGVDTFDGISRAYSYVFGRPWQVILYHGLPMVFLFIFFIFAGLFIRVSLVSVAPIMGDKWKPVAVDAASHSMKPQLAYELGKRWNIDPRNPYKKPSAGKKAMIDQALTALDSAKHNMVAVSKKELNDNEALRKALKKIGYVRGKALRPEIYKKARTELAPREAMLGFAAKIYCTIIWIASQLIFAFLISYWLGAQTKAYFLLRHDVDGDDFEEMYLEEDEEDAFSFDVDEEKPPEQPGVTTPPPFTEEKKEEEKPKPKRRYKKKTEEMGTGGEIEDKPKRRRRSSKKSTETKIEEKKDEEKKD